MHGIRKYKVVTRSLIVHIGSWQYRSRARSRYNLMIEMPGHKAVAGSTVQSTPLLPLIAHYGRLRDAGQTLQYLASPVGSQSSHGSDCTLFVCTVVF